MESLSATVDARDAYAAGHSRRVQQLALAIGRRLGLSQAELDLLGHAALFHDIGKLAIPDAILLKPASLTRRVGPDGRHADEVRASSTAQLPAGRGPRDSPPPRALRRHRLSGRHHRREIPSARASSTWPTRSIRCSRPASTARRAGRRGSELGAGVRQPAYARAASRRSSACFRPRSPARPSRPRSSSPPPEPFAGRLACSILCGDRRATFAALHRRNAPRRAPRLCQTPRTLADDARVRAGCAGEAASQTIVARFGSWNGAEAAPGSSRDGSRPVRASAPAPGSSAPSWRGPDGLRPRAEATLDAVEISVLADVRLVPRASCGRFRLSRGRKSGPSARWRRAFALRRGSAACRPSRTGRGAGTNPAAPERMAGLPALRRAHGRLGGVPAEG